MCGKRGPNGRLNRPVSRGELDFYYSTQPALANLQRNRGRVASIQSRAVSAPVLLFPQSTFEDIQPNNEKSTPSR